ncbi:MAG: chemotaxis protein CheW [Acidobacteriota bacterium]
MIPDHKAAYREEARELLAELESALLELEERPRDSEVIGRVFRALHTIKGSGAMFGFDTVAAFTHEVETVFDLVRNGSLSVTGQLVGLTLASGDHIRSLLENPEGTEEDHGRSIIASLKELTTRMPPEPIVEETDVPPQPVGGERGEVTYRIRFRPNPELFMTGTNPIMLLNELRELGGCTVMAQTESVPLLSDIDPEECRTYWDVVLTTNRGIDAVRDVFIFVEDQCELTVEVIDDGGPQEPFDVEEASPKKLGEILVERGDIGSNDLKETLSGQKRLGEMLVQSGTVDRGLVESALAEQEHLKAVHKEHVASEAAATIRVPVEKLDALVNLIGELVTVQARLSQTATRRADAEFLSIAEEVERLTVDLRDNTMNIRMVPIGTTFSKFKRLVRDLSQDLGKEVVLTTDGAETELDKTVIERLNDPLVHLIRNSIDHGIEPPEARSAAGKSRQGTVHLSAIHSGSNVLIRIEDDGAGLDPAAIRAKAVAKGLLDADAAISDKDLFSLIFAPGFSTAKSITSVSGRGVGMDVVKRSIEALRGSIEVESRQGTGSAITLKLPLTLAIIDGLLVRIGETSFVLPLSIVQECIELSHRDESADHGKRLAKVRGELVPYIRLRDRFGIVGAVPEIEQIVITEGVGGKVGFAVDQVMGEHQTVIKNLSRIYRNVEGVSGATILGDGTVALILDAQKLIAQVESEQ